MQKDDMASSMLELGSRTVRMSGPAPYPVDLTRLKGVDFAARYHSKRRGGDFFDGVAFGERLIFLLMDIAGSRAETQPIAAEAQFVFRERATAAFHRDDVNEADAIAATAHDINRGLIEAAHGVRFAPTFLGCFNLRLGLLTYCNAGRVLAVFRDAEGVQVLESGAGLPLGLFTHITFEPALLAFEPEDKLLLVTKGVTECRRGAREFGEKRVRSVLEHSDGNSAAVICDTVLDEAYDYGYHSWSRLYNLVQPRKHRLHEDLTAVALVRREG